MNKMFSGVLVGIARVLVADAITAGAKCIETGINKANARKEEKRMWDAYYNTTKSNLYYYWEVIRQMNNFEVEVL